MVQIDITVFPLWWSVLASTSVTDGMTFFNVAHYARMGPLSRGDEMMLEYVGFELRQKCLTPLFLA